MTYPLEIVDQLAKKYFSIKAIAISTELVEPFFRSPPEYSRKICGETIKDFVEYDKIFAEMEKRDGTIDQFYQRLFLLEEELENPDPQRVKSALESISDLNVQIRNTNCPGFKTGLKRFDSSSGRKHDWHTPTCFDSSHEINGQYQDYFSSYTICRPCGNFVIDI